MSVPLSTLLGLLALLGVAELAQPIPGEAEAARAALFALALLVPLLLLEGARSLLLARIVAGRRTLVPPRALLNLSTLSVPMVLWLLLGPGGLSELLERCELGATLRLFLLSLPLLLIEVPRLAMATLLELWCEADAEWGRGSPTPRHYLPGMHEAWPTLRLRYGWLLLLAMPQLLLGLALDLVSVAPALDGVVRYTGLGATVGALLFLLLLAVVLPWWFRIAFHVQPLPEPLGTHLREVAARLGFGGRLFLLPTGQRALNAMMVGPLPIQRGLGLTDAFVATLDETTLAGVVAHEVGHARAAHPVLLAATAIGLPLLLLAQAEGLGVAQWPSELHVLVAVSVAFVIWGVVRKLAHRFEHEADAASVAALGAAPCSHALRVVQSLAMAHTPGFLGRMTSMHPDDHARHELMRRLEMDPAYREQFARNGRRVRVGIGIAMALATGAAAVRWVLDWPYERALLAVHRGDVASAVALLENANATVPTHWRKTWEQLTGTMLVAKSIAADAKTWEQAQAAARAAWPTAVAVLRRDGPAAAASWMDVVVGVDDHPELVRQTLRTYCRAAADLDSERMTKAAQVIRRLGVPAGLEQVF